MLDNEKTITLTDGRIITIIGPIVESDFDNNSQEYTPKYIEKYLIDNPSLQIKELIYPETIEKIPDEIDVIKDEAKKIILPKFLKKISCSFFEYSSLEEIIIPESVEEIGDSAFSDCRSLKRVVLSSRIKNIESTTFEYCTSLEEIIIPESVEQIGEAAFSFCTSLKKVVLSNKIKKIESNTFSDCSSLKEIIIPESVEQIGDSAFSDCKSLKRIALSSRMKNIESNTFSYCTSLNNIIIPEGVETISYKAFCHCEKLKRIILPSTLKVIAEDAFYDCQSLEEIIISENVEQIGEAAFSDCVSLKKVVLSNKIKKIESNTFSYCTSLEEIVIPEGVEIIKYYAFDGCKNLKRIVLPSTLKEIAEDAFFDCSSLKEIYTYESVKKKIKKSLNNIHHEKTPEIITIDDEKLVDSSDLIELEIPKGTTILTKDIVETIFYNNKNLENIKIPSGIEIIEEDAFSGKDIKSIYISEGVEIIEDNAFQFCDKLTKIRLPNTLKKIGESAFEQCSLLERIEIPEGVELIDEWCFFKCINLQKVTLPSTLKEIGKHAFEQCYKLNNINIPEGVKELKEYTFYNCENLKDIYLPSTLRKIDNCAFYKCPSLKKVFIPEGVEEIEEGTFSSASNIESLFLPKSLKKISAQIIEYASLKKLYLHINSSVDFPSLSLFLKDSRAKLDELVLIYDNTPKLKEYFNKNIKYIDNYKYDNPKCTIKIAGPNISFFETLYLKSQLNFIHVQPNSILDEIEPKPFSYVRETEINKLITKIYRDIAYLPKGIKAKFVTKINTLLEDYENNLKQMMTDCSYDSFKNYDDFIKSFNYRLEKINNKADRIGNLNKFAKKLDEYIDLLKESPTLSKNQDPLYEKIVLIVIMAKSFNDNYKKKTLLKISNIINNILEATELEILKSFDINDMIYIDLEPHERILSNKILELYNKVSEQYEELNQYSNLLQALKEFHPHYDIEADDLVSFIKSIQYVLTIFPDPDLQNEYKQILKDIEKKYIPILEKCINYYPNLIIPNLYDTIEKNLRYDLQDYLIKLKDVKFNKDIIIKIAEEDYKARKERLLTKLNNCLIIVTNGLKIEEKENSDTNIGILDEIQTIENEYLNNEFIDFEIKIIIRLQLIAIIENNIERVINNVKDIVSYFEEKNILVNELEDLLFDIHRLIQKTNIHQERTHI